MDDDEAGRRGARKGGGQKAIGEKSDWTQEVEKERDEAEGDLGKIEMRQQKRQVRKAEKKGKEELDDKNVGKKWK